MVESQEICSGPILDSPRGKGPKIIRIPPLLGALAALAIWPGAAYATVVDVRIEGKNATLFEGPIETSGRNVQAISERSTGAIRKCDGTNGGSNPSPGATPTAAAVDAMSIAGQGFEGRWNNDLQDYFIRGFGSDLESGGAYWGLFVNGTSSAIGGCQQVLDGSKRVLWVYDAFRGRPLLTLSGPDTVAAGGTATYTVTQAGGTAKRLETTTVSGGTSIAATGSDGTVHVTFGGDGWYRLKAANDASFVRSNRIYVCVGACGAAPIDRGVQTPPAPAFYGPGGAVLPSPQTLATTTTPLSISRAVAGSSGYRRGRIAVRWSITRQGVGLMRWTIGARDLSAKSARYVTRASGTTQTSALVKLPAGRTYALRFTSVDRMLNSATLGVGRVLVPFDDRSKAIKRAGPWRKVRSRSAWDGTVLRGRRSARLAVRLPRGRTGVLLRAYGAATLRIGSRQVRVPARRRGARLVVYGPKRSKSSVVKVRVLRGTVDLDGVAASP